MSKVRILAICVTIPLLVAALGLSIWNRPDTTLPFGGVAHIDSAPAVDSDPEPVIDEPPGDVLKITISEEMIDGFPASVAIVDGQRTYSLDYTGQFTRRRGILFFDIDLYAIASYVEAPEPGETEALLDEMLVDGVRRVYLLRMLKTIPARAIAGAMDEEIDNYFIDIDMDRLGGAIDEFRGVFGHGAKRGQVVYMAWLPGGRSYASFNDAEHVELVAEDLPLARAIWRIWAGKHSGPERVGLVERLARQPSSPATN